MSLVGQFTGESLFEDDNASFLQVSAKPSTASVEGASLSPGIDFWQFARIHLGGRSIFFHTSFHGCLYRLRAGRINSQHHHIFLPLLIHFSLSDFILTGLDKIPWMFSPGHSAFERGGNFGNSSNRTAFLASTTLFLGHRCYLLHCHQLLFYFSPALQIFPRASRGAPLTFRPPIPKPLLCFYAGKP
ncbi:MAG: hypothetical protein RLZZ399_2692 [Verrucomicrobiota bacterium]